MATDQDTAVVGCAKGSWDMSGFDVTNSFEFVVLASLRVRQLVDGCTPRVQGEGKKTTIAKREVLAGKIAKIAPAIRL